MIKSDIIKTDEFFVGKKGEKKMYLINKLDFLFDQLHRQVDAAIKEDRKSAFREKRNSDRREYRRWMRKHCFEVYLFDDDFDYKSIELIYLPTLPRRISSTTLSSLKGRRTVQLS